MLAGKPVTAFIGGNVCGAGLTLTVDSQVVYSVNVQADMAGRAAGCGAPGRQVTFRVDTQDIAQSAEWVAGPAREQPLSAAAQ